MQKEPYTFLDCFTYSPNWYIESAICVDVYQHNVLYYASNSLVFAYDIRTHKVTEEIQCRQIIKQKKQFPIEIIDSVKACSIVATQESLVIGLNDGVVIVLNKKTGTYYVHQLGLGSLYTVVALNENELVLIDDQGTCGKAPIGKLASLEIKIRNKKSKCKKVLRINEYWVVFFQSGEIHLFDRDFNKELRKVNWFKGQSILTLDCIGNRILVLSRAHDDLKITYLEFSFGHEFPLQHTKTVYEVCTNLHRCSVTFQYPKKFQYRRDDIKKAALTIKLTSPTTFLLSGRVGQLYYFDLTKLSQQKLELRAFSNIEEELPYLVVSSSHHFQDIYAIYSYPGHLITVGTDRNMTFWACDGENITYQYQQRFLASKVRTIFKSGCERNFCFLLMDDSVIRSWDVEEHIKGQSIMNEYWKAGKKVTIQKVCACPTEEGIMAILTSRHQVVIYDLYQERFVREYEFTDDACQIAFLSRETLISLCQFLEHEPYQVHLTSKELFKRTFAEGSCLAVYDKNYITIIDLSNGTCHRLGKFFKDMINTEFIEDFFFGHGAIISVVKSPTTFSFYVYNNRRVSKHSFGEQLASHRYYLRVVSQARAVVSIWKNKDIRILVFDISSEIKIVAEGGCHFNYYVNYCEVSPDGNKLLCYSNLNTTLQIWDINVSGDIVSTVSRNIKAHQGYIIGASFFNNQYGISCSQDQNIKVWDLTAIPQRAPPKGKSHKTNRKKRTANDSKLEQDQSQEQLKKL